MDSARSAIEDYQDRFPGSAALHERASEVLAGGAAHDMWDTDPFPLYFERAKGPCKWDHQDNRFIDFWTGHGAHLCGHAFEPVLEAVSARLGLGTHLTAPAEAQIRWAEQVCALVPCAERVRFTSSGTEATLLALRVARACTGRRHVIKFNGHFHGWHDELLSDYSERSAAGRHPSSGELRSLYECTDIAGACSRMAQGDVAAVILEPGGGSSGALPWSAADLQELRDAATRAGTVLVFDEVVSGFRYRPGGAQELAGVTPDLTALGKILGGGFPGAALAGRSDVMDMFGGEVSAHTNRSKVMHTGTFNGNVLSATAGAAMLEAIADGSHQLAAERGAEALVAGVNAAAESVRVDLHAYRHSSIFHILIGARTHGVPLGASAAVLAHQKRTEATYGVLRPALLLEGVDAHGSHGWVSSAHEEQVITDAIDGFERALRRVRVPLERVIESTAP